MAIPTSSYFSTFDITSRTEKQVLDQQIWAIMQPKVPVLDLISKGEEIDSIRYEWEYRKPDPKYVTADGSTGNLTNNSSTGTTLVLAAGEGAKVEVGTILRDTAQALVTAADGTTLATGAKMGELLQVTAVSTDSLTVVRDVANYRGTGTTVPTHAVSAVYEIMWTPRQESSAAGLDMFQTLGIMENWTVTQDFYLTISGSQAKRAMNNMNAAAQMTMQYEDRMLGAARRIESALLYGFKMPTTPQGSDSVIREMAGLFDFLARAGGNADYTTTALTPAALNAAFKKIYVDGGDPEEPYAIICNPDQAQLISSFGEDKVRVERTDAQYGRYITSYKSDLGFVGQVVPAIGCHKSDLAIVNTRKWKYLPYRPWFKKAPEQLADGEVQRAITEFTSQVIDPLTAHASFNALT
jgi:hypothetical protein